MYVYYNVIQVIQTIIITGIRNSIRILRKLEKCVRNEVLFVMVFLVSPENQSVN